MIPTLDFEISEKLLTKGKRVAVALSGGADSVCLLHLVHELSEKKGFRLYALHLNHMIRGEEADRDESSSQSFSASLGVEFVSESRDVPRIAAESGKSLEEAARDERYSFFARIMEEKGINVLLTAHNADDNAETLILRLLRGTTLDGIAGIPKIREESFGVIARPLLSVSKADILSYLHEKGIPYVTDSTNSDTAYLRNRVRKNIIPELISMNPAFLESVSRSTRSFRDDSDYLIEEAKRLLFAATEKRGVSVSMIKSAPETILRRAVMMLCLENGARPEASHMEKITEGLKNGDFELSLPGAKRLLSEFGYLSVIKDKRSPKSFEGYQMTLCEGENILSLEEYGLSLSVEVKRLAGEMPCGCESKSEVADGKYILTSNDTVYADRASLCVATRSPGDTVFLGSFNKDIRRLFSEKKIQKALRPFFPIVRDCDGVLLIPGVLRAVQNTSKDAYTVKTRLILKYDI